MYKFFPSTSSQNKIYTRKGTKTKIALQVQEHGEQVRDKWIIIRLNNQSSLTFLISKQIKQYELIHKSTINQENLVKYTDTHFLNEHKKKKKCIEVERKVPKMSEMRSTAIWELGDPTTQDLRPPSSSTDPVVTQLVFRFGGFSQH